MRFPGAWKRLHRYPNRVALPQIVLLGRLCKNAMLVFILWVPSVVRGERLCVLVKALENFTDVSRAGLDECMRFSPSGSRARCGTEIRVRKDQDAQMVFA